MKKFPFIIPFIFLTSFCHAQKLIVENVKTRKQRKIEIGRIMTVATAEDPSPNPFLFYTDTTKTTGKYCPNGCYRLVAINVEKNTFTIKRDTVTTEYDVNDVKEVRYVRTKHPGGIKAIRAVLATAGTFILVGRTVTAGNNDSADEKITEFAMGTACLAASLLIRSNVPRTYKVIGVEK